MFGIKKLSYIEEQCINQDYPIGPFSCTIFFSDTNVDSNKRNNKYFNPNPLMEIINSHGRIADSFGLESWETADEIALYNNGCEIPSTINYALEYLSKSTLFDSIEIDYCPRYADKILFIFENNKFIKNIKLYGDFPIEWFQKFMRAGVKAQWRKLAIFFASGCNYLVHSFSSLNDINLEELCLDQYYNDSIFNILISNKTIKRLVLTNIGLDYNFNIKYSYDRSLDKFIKKESVFECSHDKSLDNFIKNNSTIEHLKIDTYYFDMIHLLIKQYNSKITLHKFGF